MCVECGLVLDRIIGESGGRFRQRRVADGTGEGGGGGYGDGYGDDSGGAEVALRADGDGGETLIRSVLAVLHLDNQHVEERAAENYRKIYGSRRQRPGFRKTDLLRRLACAFSICNTLNRLQMPRPPVYVTDLCGVPPHPATPLLNIRERLNLSEEELRGMKREDYELEQAEAQDYLDVVCAHLGVAFNTAGEARRMAEEVQWAVYGKKPTSIAAAVLQTVLARRGELGGAVTREDICDAFDCRQKCVDLVLRDVERYFRQQQQQ